MMLAELKVCGTYVAVRPTMLSLVALDDWAHFNRIKLEDDVHITLLYSRNVKKVKVNSTITYHAMPLKFGPLGTSDLVVHLFSPELSERHNELMNQGHTHDYENFDAHMTLIKKNSNVNFNKLSKMPPLQFSNEYTEPLNK